jgi:TonB family protein
MNRLQKKCVIGTVGIHLLLFVILIVGPAFYNREPKTDDTQVLDVIPANLVDAAVNSGVKDAQAPQPTPVQPRPPQPQQLYAPPPPVPHVVQPPTPTPPAPAPTLSPSLLDEFKKMFTSKPAPSVTPDLTPTEKPVKSEDNNIKIDLHKVKRTTQKETSPTDNTSNTKAINSELRSLKSSLSHSTKIDVPGDGSAASANYAAVVKSVYFRTILSNLPTEGANNSDSTMVKVTIASDGTVVSSEIVTPSGDPAWDNAVQRTLDQVKFIAAFPSGSTDSERHYTLDFNPQVERALQ